MKKKNSPDGTLRNIKAANKKFNALEKRVKELERQMRLVAVRLSMILDTLCETTTKKTKKSK